MGRWRGSRSGSGPARQSTAPGANSSRAAAARGPAPLDEDDAVLRDRSSSDHDPYRHALGHARGERLRRGTQRPPYPAAACYRVINLERDDAGSAKSRPDPVRRPPDEHDVGAAGPPGGAGGDRRRRLPVPPAVPRKARARPSACTAQRVHGEVPLAAPARRVDVVDRDGPPGRVTRFLSSVRTFRWTMPRAMFDAGAAGIHLLVQNRSRYFFAASL